MMEEELKKRKIEFLKKEENQMTPSQVTIKLGDHMELIEELFEKLEEKDQEVLTLAEKVKKLEDTTTVIISSFQMQLELMQKEINDLKIGNTVKETIEMPKMETVNSPIAEAKEPTMQKETPLNPWKTTSSKKTNRETNQSTTKGKSPPTSFKEAVQSGNQSSQMSQAQFVAKTRKDIQLVEKPCLTLLQKDNFEAVQEIASMTLRIRLNAKGQICPLDAMKRIIEEIVGIQPLSLSVISPTSVQILFKKGDLASFQKLVIPNKIELVEPKKDNFQQRDINRIAQLYLRGYYKELARAALQGLPTSTIELVLVKATELVKTRFQNKITQKQWMFNIQKDKIAFQSAAMEMDV